MSESPEFILDRVFNAPRELVWQAWTDPELLHHWYGPGVETVIHKFDLLEHRRQPHDAGLAANTANDGDLR